MKPQWKNRNAVIGWLVLSGAILTGLFTTLEHGVDNSGAGASPADHRSQATTANTVPSPGKSKAVGRAGVRERTVDVPSARKLQEILATGDLNAVHEELQALSDAGRLSEVGELLKTWCREGGIELAQWSLALSHESDRKLNLELQVEALSNPEEVIREISAAELENLSGIRFTDVAPARSWLGTQQRQ